MPVEIKNEQSTTEERDLGTKLVDKYKRESNILLSGYIEQHDVLLRVRKSQGDVIYMEQKKKPWAAYKKADKALHDKFMDDAEVLGFKMRAI